MTTTFTSSIAFREVVVSEGDGPPLVFLAFRHNRIVSLEAERLRDDLVSRGVVAYRAMDDPRPGDSLPAKIERWIERADGVVLFWSSQGSESPAVRSEYEIAKRLGRKICLVKYRGVSPPSDWTETEWIEIHGVRKVAPSRVRGPPIIFVHPAWSRFADSVAAFARQARAERQPRR